MATNKVKELHEKKLNQEVKSLFENRTIRFKEVFHGHDLSDEDLDRLVKSKVHPTEAEKLLKENCPPDLVVEILT